LGDSEAARVTEAAAAGAVVFACGANAFLDECGVYREKLGAPLASLLGFTVSDHSPRREPGQIDGAGWQGTSLAGAVQIPADVPGATVLARFTAGSWAGQPAARERLGGKVIYSATAGSSVCYPLLCRAATTGVASIDNPYEDVGSSLDLTGRGRWYFNHGSEERIIDGIAVKAGDYMG